MSEPLGGKIALVTGASRGIGRAIALKLARAGCDVALVYRSGHDEVDAACSALRALGRRALAIQADVSDPESVAEAFAVFRQQFDRVDLVVSNAATGVLRPALELTLKHWRRCLETNALALNLLAQQAVPLMPEGGRLVGISSLGASRAIPNYAYIGASKAALESVARSLAQELGPRGIRVNIVNAGVVDTDALKYFPNRDQLLAEYARRAPAGPTLTPEDVANAVYLLCLPEAAMITGHTLVVDGGYCIFRMNGSNLTDSGLTGGVAIVTGGSRGIGRAVVQTLAAAGMEVVFTFRENRAAAAEVTGAVPGAKITAEAVNVCDAAACDTFAEKVFNRTGRLDLLVNNAGVIRDNPLGALEPPDVRAVLATNVEGTFNMTRAVLPFMVSQRRGKIVNISSVSGEKGGRGQTNYAASKGAINAFTRSLAVEVAPRGILVNAVAPGVIETEMSRAVRDLAGDQIKARILLRRFGRPEEVAHAVWFLSSRYADYITGQVLHVDGGFKME